MKIFPLILSIFIINIIYSTHLKKETNLIKSELNSEEKIENIQNQYKRVEYVEKLPEKMPLTDGTKVIVDEIPSNKNYYDGTIGLKTETLTACNVYTTQPQVCVGQEHCGWCGIMNSCVEGNANGPKTPCGASYVFNAPTPDWNPFTNVSSTIVDVGGKKLTKFVVNE